MEAGSAAAKKIGLPVWQPFNETQERGPATTFATPSQAHAARMGVQPTGDCDVRWLWTAVRRQEYVAATFRDVLLRSDNADAR